MHFRSYLRGAQFTLRTDHSSLRWLQKFRNSDGMLARWYMLLGQFSVTFEYCPGAQHANVDGMSRQCGQCMRPGCPVFSPDSRDSMDADLLRNYMGKHGWRPPIWMNLPPTGSEQDFVIASRQNVTLTTVRKWVKSGTAPVWSGCVGLSPELRCWRLQDGNLSVDTEGRL